MFHEGLFRELVENSNDILIVTDQEFRIRYISSSVARVFRIEPTKLVGQNIFSFVSEDKMASWKACLQNETTTIFQDEIALTVSKGEKNYFDVNISPLETKSGLVIKLHDITQKKYRETELIKSNEQLDQVIYKTTHDLKAPIRSAMGLINLAEKAPDQEKNIYLGLIKKSLLRLDSFIEEMNHFFRNEKLALQREKINIVELLKDEVSNLLSHSVDQKIDVRFDIAGSTEFFSDAIRVRTIVTNILSNAIKYSDPGKPEPFIKISVLVKEEFCDIRISDNGIGIETQYLNSIFDLFFRATNHSSGTGIGLFIVKDTVEKLKGVIEVDSIPGEGTAFMIRIPTRYTNQSRLDKEIRAGSQSFYREGLFSVHSVRYFSYFSIIDIHCFFRLNLMKVRGDAFIVYRTSYHF
jgi:PAS domain S-box-containing protein